MRSAQRDDLSVRFASPMENWNIDPVTLVRGQWESAADGLLCELDEALRKQAQASDALPVTLTLQYMRPKKAVRGVAEPCVDDPAYAAWQQEVDALFAQGYTVVQSSEAGYGPVWPSRYREDVEAQNERYMALTPLEEYQEYLNLEPLEPVEISFAADSRRAADNVHDVAPKESWNNGRFTIRFEHVLLTPLTTYIRAVITPEEPFVSMQTLRDAMAWFAFFDEERRPLSFLDGEYMCDAGVEEQPDGTLALVVDYSMPALKTVPKAIVMAPYNIESRAEDPLWDWSVLLPVS